MLTHVHKILIITGVRIGDQLMTTPFFRTMRYAFPGAKITVATGFPALNVLKNNPSIDELITVSRTIINKVIRKGKFDLTIDLFCQRDTAYLGVISGAKKRIGLRNVGSSDADRELYTFVSNKKSRKDFSFMDYPLNLAKKIGLRLQGRNTEIFLMPGEFKKAKQILKTKGLRRQDFIVGVFVSGSRRRILWRPEKFGLLADAIAGKFNAKILFFYDKSERNDLQKATSVMKHRYFLSGEHEIRTISALVSSCDCVVVSDRGPLHIAAALQVPVIAVLGPHSEKGFFPYSRRNNLIVAKKIDCRPCNMGYKVCAYNINCLNTLSVDEVWKKAAPFLNRVIKRKNKTQLCQAINRAKGRSVS